MRPSRAAAVRTAFVGLSALASGVGSYVFLIVVSKNATPEQYSEFAVFWSLTVTLGLGVFYPVEQETAREVSARERTSGRGMTRFVLTAGLILALAVSVAALLLLTPPGQAFIGAPGLVIALIASFLAYGIQFPLRGLLSGSRRTTGYSTIITSEGILRIVLPLLLVVSGVSSPVAFAFVVAVAAALAVVPPLLDRDRSWLAHPRAQVRPFARRAASLIVAALSIQLLLNSGTLLAKGVTTGDDVALAGQVLACISISRIPVFAYQVLQILYLPRLSSEWSSGRLADARRTVLVAVGGAAVVGVIVVVGMVLLGPWVTALLFGPDLVLSQAGTALVSAGVAVFLVALVLSDGAIAIGQHRLVVRSWLVGLACAVVVTLLAGDLLLRVTAPFIVGALVAAVQLLVGVLLRYQARLRESGTAPR